MSWILVILLVSALLAWPLIVRRIAVRSLSRSNAREIRKRLLSGASPHELGEETDAQIEEVSESIRKYEASPGVTQALGFGEALNHEYRKLAGLRDFRSQVIQIGRDLGLDVSGPNDTQ